MKRTVPFVVSIALFFAAAAWVLPQANPDGPPQHRKKAVRLYEALFEYAGQECRMTPKQEGRLTKLLFGGLAKQEWNKDHTLWKLDMVGEDFVSLVDVKTKQKRYLPLATIDQICFLENK